MRNLRIKTRSRGFAIVEIVVSTALVSIALLGHAASVVQEQKGAVETQERGVAILTLERFVERLRADTDWVGLYGRLRPLSSESAADANLTFLGQDASLTTYDPSAYYADFDVPARLGTVTVLVQVPSTTVSGVAGLRENVAAPRYGLPADLNGDGVANAANHASDARVLPVVVRLRWQHAGRAANEIVVATNLRGDN